MEAGFEHQEMQRNEISTIQSFHTTYWHLYSSNNSVIEITQTQRDLGVVVQRDTLWSNHYNNISRKAYMALNLIKRTLPPHASTNLKRQLPC